MQIKYSKYLAALLLLTVFLDTATASSVVITSQQDYMQQQFVSNGSFPSGITDLIYRMRLHIQPVSGNFQVSKVVIYNTTKIGINRTYYQIDGMDKGRGTVSVFPDRVEWRGLAETPAFDFELGIHAGKMYRRNIPFSSTRSIDKEIFNGQDIVTGSISATPTENLRNLKIFIYASESDDIYSQILNNTSTNTGYIDYSSPDEVAWNFQHVLAGNLYAASVKGIGTPKKNSTIRAWPYSRIEGGYGRYNYTGSGYGATVVRYTDTVIGDVEIHFVNPVDYQISANGRGTFNQRFKAYSEVITSGEPATISIDDNFMPGIRTVPSGTTVTWKNDLHLAHIIVSNTGLFSSPSLTQNQQFSYTFNSPGTYDYSCENHPSMTGKVIVTSSPIPSSSGDVVSRYAGSDGIVQRSEAVLAVMDYFSNGITRQEAISVVMAYFTGPSTPTPTISPSPTATPSPTPTPTPPTGNLIPLTSQAFRQGGNIPAKCTCDGADVSPALSWGYPPAGTKSLALILDDPDAPGGIFTHWVLYNLPANITSLPEGVQKVERPASGGIQGTNDFPGTGYGGPCPPPGGAHTYRFILYALDTELNLRSGATRLDVLNAMQGHVLAQAELDGEYGI